MDSEKPEVAEAMEWAARNQHFDPGAFGRDRMLYERHLKVLAAEVRAQAKAMSQIQAAVMALRMLVRTNPVAILGCLIDERAWEDHLRGFVDREAALSEQVAGLREALRKAPGEGCTLCCAEKPHTRDECDAPNTRALVEKALSHPAPSTVETKPCEGHYNGNGPCLECGLPR